MLERGGDVGGAIEPCRRALDLDPANREAAEMLARLEQP
ncbi:MAG: tetratricopeptide repeat protein [bacterium]|nr:tetratricopeptide repeat protein [bacterium]